MANDIIVSEMTSASQINTNDLMIMTQPDLQAETGYSTKKGTVLQVANKMLKGTEYLTDLPDFTNKTVLGGLEELKGDVKSELSNLILSTGTEDELPYQTRPTPSSLGNRCLEKLVGGTVAFNQLVPIHTASRSVTTNGITVIDNRDGSYTFYTDENGATAQTNILLAQNVGAITNGHKYFEQGFVSETSKYYCVDAYDGALAFPMNGANSFITMATISGRLDLRLRITNGTIISTPITFKPQIIDLTALFGSTIADYIYTLEQGTAGAGVAWFRNYFTADYYPYTANTLMSAKPTSKVIKDANNQTIATYAFGGAELRGIFKKDADGNLYADGDIYEADGTITRRYESRAYQAGDESLPDAITDGTTTVVKLATPTTETSTAYDNPQTVGAYEEFTDVRTIKMPCGHDTIYSKKTDYRYW